jgi:hypothetical protein
VVEQAIQGAVFATAFVCGIFSFVGLASSIERPRAGLATFAGFGILCGFMLGLGISL